MGEGADEMSRPGDYIGSPDVDADAARRQAESDTNEASSDSEANVSEIRESIRQTRADMTETIDALQERLSPSHMKDQVKEHVREQYTQLRNTIRVATVGKVEDMVERMSDTVNVTRRSIMETVSANPVPSALVGIGLAWLWMNRRSSSSGYSDYSGYRGRDRQSRARSSSGMSGGYDWDDVSGRYADRDWQRDNRDWQRDTGTGGTLTDKAGGAISAAAGKVQETASNLADRTKETASHLADRTKETVSGLVDQANEKYAYVSERAQYQARRVEELFDSSMQQSPLAVGAVALAIGTAVGLAIPQTRKENELMGEARDTLVDKAQSVASDAIGKVQQVAEKVVNETTSTTSPTGQGQSGQFGQRQSSQGQPGQSPSGQSAQSQSNQSASGQSGQAKPGQYGA
jgi:ElaB/YqjD/DUF883 family membrane-anchored ribosome-binding protein